MIAVASTSVDCTITGPSEFGSMCRNTIAPFLTPSAVAASTWSLCRCASIEPRSNRANTGICTIETARITVNWLGRANIAAIENASSSDGSDSMTSTRRMTIESTQPPMRARERAEDQAAGQSDQRRADTDEQCLL